MHQHFDDEHHRQHAWRKFEAMGRRGWFGGPGRGWGGPGGPGDPRQGGGFGGDWGDNLRIGRMLASGDLRLVALYFIEQQPRHGYDLIKAIEDKTGGLYVPSPGVIYPALTFLEEASYVTSVAEANKRLYTITDEGRTYLNDNRAAVESTLAHLGRIGEQFAKVRERWEETRRDFDQQPRPDRDMDDVAPEVNAARRELKDAIRDAARRRDPESQRRLADILRRAADEIRRGPQPGPDANADIDI
ncbi:MAG TPA: PadR family transcriptional regulator [Devosia sp.]|nr:PadR family transcriptional regulator [Devosia sp.]